MASLQEMQRAWDGSRSFPEFVAEQNRVFRECVLLETSETGKIVREELGMKPLSMADVVPD